MLSRRPVRYAEKIDRSKKRARIITNIAILIVLCLVARSLVTQTWRIENDAMVPSLHKGDIVLVVPYVLRIKGMPEGLAGGASIGDVVLISDGYELIVPARQRFVDAAIRFLTFQRLSILKNEYGDSFSVPTFMRVSSIEDNSTNEKKDLTFILSNDQQDPGTRATKLRLVSSSLIKGKAIFRIWPLSAIGPVQ